jgi:hypothetical protein
MQMNANSCKPQPYRPKIPGQMDNSDITRVARDSKRLQHWVFKGMPDNGFPALCDRVWDICLPLEVALGP